MSDNTHSAHLPFGYLLLLGLTTCSSVAFAALWYNERNRVEQPTQQPFEERIVKLLDSKKKSETAAIEPAAAERGGAQLADSRQQVMPSAVEQIGAVQPSASSSGNAQAAANLPADSLPEKQGAALSSLTPQTAQDLPAAESQDAPKAQPSRPQSKGDKLDLQLAPGFEATNLVVQHIAAVRLADGSLQKVVAEVPVLYASKSLRWNNEQLLQAHRLLGELKSWQAAQKQLLQQGAQLQYNWQKFVESTQPGMHLRADSISLPQLKTSAK